MLKINGFIFPIALDFRYIFDNIAWSRQNEKMCKPIFCIALDFRYICKNFIVITLLYGQRYL